MKMKTLVAAAMILLAAYSCCSSGETFPVRVYESAERNSILFDTERDSALVLVSSGHWVFTVLFESRNREWIIAERAPAYPGEGRIETGHLLFNVPRRLIVDIEAFNNKVTDYGMFFATDRGREYLVTLNRETQEEVFIPLDILPTEEGEFATRAGEAGRPGFSEEAATDYGREGHYNGTFPDEPSAIRSETVKLVFELGIDEYQIGQGKAEKWLEGGRLIYAVPSFSVNNGLLYLIDAINFRVMVYDLTGDLIRIIGYPRINTAGNTTVIRDIALNDQFIYLLSVYDCSVYVLDSATGDVVAVIDGSDTPAGRFGDVRRVQLDYGDRLILADHFGNDLYVYSLQGTSFKLENAAVYEHGGQLVPAPCGTVYRAEATANGFEVTADDGSPEIVVECDDPVDNAVVAGTCINGNIYVRVAKNGMSQYGATEILYILSSSGKITGKTGLTGWTGGGPMQRSMVISREGEVFEACFDGDNGHDEADISKLTISRIF